MYDVFAAENCGLIANLRYGHGVKSKNNYLENELLLISINFTPKISHSCLKKKVHYVFQVQL